MRVRPRDSVHFFLRFLIIGPGMAPRIAPEGAPKTPPTANASLSFDKSATRNHPKAALSNTTPISRRCVPLSVPAIAPPTPVKNPNDHLKLKELAVDIASIPATVPTMAPESAPFTLSCHVGV